MIDARCLTCRRQWSRAEFIADGGKLGEWIAVGTFLGKPYRIQEGICWRCDREKRAQAMGEGVND